MRSWVLLVGLIVTGIACADTAVTQTAPKQVIALSGDAIKHAEEKFKATFAKTTYMSFEPSPMEGLFTVRTGQSVFYFSPEKKLLIFGQIYDSNGNNLTVLDQQASLVKKLSAINLSQATVLGPENGTPIVEFLSLQCGFCKQYHAFISEHTNVKRQIFFLTEKGSADEKIAMAVECSSPEKRRELLDLIYTGKYSLKEPTKVCDKGAERIEQQRRLAQSLGIDRTPSFLLGSRNSALVAGFKRGEILSYLQSSTKPQGEHP